MFWEALAVYMFWNIGTKSHFSDASHRVLGLGRQNGSECRTAPERKASLLTETIDQDGEDILKAQLHVRGETEPSGNPSGA
jgi:hypothetical protein